MMKEYFYVMVVASIRYFFVMIKYVQKKISTALHSLLIIMTLLLLLLLYRSVCSIKIM